MKYSVVTGFVQILIISFCFTACSGRPEAQIGRTDQAREQAMAVEASIFASEQWVAADAAYREAQKMLEQEKWREANTQLLKAMTGYQKARNIAQGKREDKIQGIRNTQKTVQLRAEALQQLFRENLGKFSPARRKEFEETWKGFDEKLATVSSHLEQKRYQDAEMLAGKTLREIWELRQEMEKITGKSAS